MKLRIPISKKRTRGKHRKKRTYFENLWEYVWPSIGWRGLLRWVEIGIKRSAGNTHSVALGVAFGTFISFTPTVGIQTVFMVLFCWLFRANFPACFLTSVVVGNPWTFPFIWFWIYELGHFILRTKAEQSLPLQWSLAEVWENFGYYWKKYIFPMLIGGIPSGLVFGLLAYWAVLLEVTGYRKARSAYLIARREKYIEKFKEKILGLDKKNVK